MNLPIHKYLSHTYNAFAIGQSNAWNSYVYYERDVYLYYKGYWSRIPKNWVLV